MLTQCMTPFSIFITPLKYLQSENDPGITAVGDVAVENDFVSGRVVTVHLDAAHKGRNRTQDDFLDLV